MAEKCQNLMKRVHLRQQQMLCVKTVSVHIPDQENGAGCQGGPRCSGTQSRPVPTVLVAQPHQTSAQKAAAVVGISFGNHRPWWVVCCMEPKEGSNNIATGPQDLEGKQQLIRSITHFSYRIKQVIPKCGSETN